MEITRLVGVYDADGTIRGELTYLVRRARGTAHCALCDVTHGRLRPRQDFEAARGALARPLELHHRDEIDDQVRTAAGGQYPCIVGVGPDGARLLLDRDEIERFGGDPVRLVERINELL